LFTRDRPGDHWAEGSPDHDQNRKEASAVRDRRRRSGGRGRPDFVRPARADTITTSTTCTNAYTGAAAWTPDQAGTATFTLGDFSFDIVAFGITIPVSCTFDSTPPAVSSVVSSS